MTYGGARGETETQMAEVLHYSLPQGRLHPAFNDLDRTMARYGHSYDGLELKIANAIWSQDGYSFQDAYLDLLAENYGAGLFKLDFVNEPDAARDTINNWAKEQTEGRIADLVRMPNSLTRLLLTNTIYFDAKWAVPFDLFYTHDDIFRLLDGSKVEVPMMEQEGYFPYTEGDGYQAIALRYKGAGPIRMIFVLPEEGRFKEIEASFTADHIESIVDDLDTQLVVLTLPKFEFDSELNLRDTLARLGMPDAFNMGEADFSGMLDEQNEAERALYIGDVVHKAFVDVHEEGTEAAAATAIEMVEESLVVKETPEVPIIMKLDRPFLFLIREPNGTILFAGRVLNPEG
jgi:serpin B